jgi:hypothetical protein
LKKPHHGGVAPYGLSQDLDRYHAIQATVSADVDICHSASTQKLFDMNLAYETADPVFFHDCALSSDVYDTSGLGVLVDRRPS